MISVVIPTIGRKTVVKAIESILREGMKPVIVSDGIDLNYDILKDPAVQYVKLGRRFGKTPEKTYYGQIALTVGYYLSTTEFTACIGDDDELCVGAGKIYQDAIDSNPSIDIWIPTLLYNDGSLCCLNKDIDLVVGNVSHPMYRSIIYSFIPMYHKDEIHQIHDFTHVKACVDAGYKVDWIGKPCVLIRPKLEGKFGSGFVNTPKQFKLF